MRFRSSSDTGSGLYCRTLRRARIASQASMSSFRLRLWRQCDRDLVDGITLVSFRVMGMTLRPSDQQAEALRQQAADEGRSMQAVALSAIDEYIARRAHKAKVAGALQRV